MSAAYSKKKLESRYNAMLKKKELERQKEQKKQDAARQLKFAECIENAEDVETRSISKYNNIWNLLLVCSYLKLIRTIAP